MIPQRRVLPGDWFLRTPATGEAFGPPAKVISCGGSRIHWTARVSLTSAHIVYGECSTRDVFARVSSEAFGIAVAVEVARLKNVLRVEELNAKAEELNAELRSAQDAYNHGLAKFFALDRFSGTLPQPKKGN